MLNNIQLNNVPTAVGVTNGATVLAGGTTTIQTWVQGNIYSGTSSSGQFVQASESAPTKPAVLLDSAGRIFGKSHPQYADYAVDQFVSVRSNGATGDGSTDDTAAIQNVINEVCSNLLAKAFVFSKLPSSTLDARTSSSTRAHT